MHNNELTGREFLVTIVLLVAVVFGVRAVWAKLVYNDMRCAFAECRIEVNP